MANEADRNERPAEAPKLRHLRVNPRSELAAAEPQAPLSTKERGKRLQWNKRRLTKWEGIDHAG